MEKCISPYVFSFNITILGNTYNVSSGVDCILDFECYWILNIMYVYLFCFILTFSTLQIILRGVIHYDKIVCIEIGDRSENKTFQTSI